MPDHTDQLRAFAQRHDFFIGIDSDGCAFDTMELKHKECFIPQMINCWDLQPIARFARSAAEFVNLYSRHRGSNRFVAALTTFDLLADWDEPRARGFEPPPLEPLRRWVADETRLSTATLEPVVERTGDAVLARALAWSKASDEAVAAMVRNVPPFPLVRESIDAAAGRADLMVVSATPQAALEREWSEHGLARRMAMICGQEQGSKKEHLHYAAGSRYDRHKVLMIGDAPGDLKAARAGGFLFYPIVPGREDRSWRRFHDEAMERFFAGAYAGPYEEALVAEFLGGLPETPPWAQG